MLIPDWMSPEEVEQAFLLISNPEEPQLVPQVLEKLSQDDWESLFLAYQFLMLARERESLH
jgi:hypothetical protein